MLSLGQAAPRSQQSPDLLNIELAKIDLSQWFAPSVGRVLAVVLVVQVLLFVSDQYEWGIFGKGHAVLVTVAATAFLLLVLGGCVLVSFITQSRSQFSLATMLFMFPVMAIPCAWLAHDMDVARRQRDVVESLRVPHREWLYGGEPRGFSVPMMRDTQLAAWLQTQLGKEFFSDVTYVEMHDAEDADVDALTSLNRLDMLVLDESPVTDAALANLTVHNHLRGVSLIDSQITDGGLEHLKKLSHLKWIFLAGAPVTDRGVKELREALPECKVVRSRYWPRHW